MVLFLILISNFSLKIVEICEGRDVWKKDYIYKFEKKL